MKTLPSITLNTGRVVRHQPLYIDGKFEGFECILDDGVEMTKEEYEDYFFKALALED